MTKNKVIFVVMLFSAATNAGLLIPLSVLFIESLGISLVLVGILLFGREGSSVIGRLPLGGLSDKIGRKPILLLGTGCYTISPLGYSLFTKPLFIFPFTVLHGIGIAAIWTAAYAVVSDITSEETVGRAIGLFSLVPGIGFSIGTVLGGFLSRDDQFIITYRAAIILGLIAFLLCLSSFKETHTYSERKMLHSEAPQNNVSYKQLFQNPIILLATVIGLAVSLLLYMCLNFFPLLGDQIGLSVDLIAFILIAQSLIGGTLMSPFIGILADRFDKTKLLLALLLLGIVVVSVIPLMNTFSAFFILFFLLGVVGGGIHVIPMALITENIQNTQKGFGMGLIQTANQMGRAISPLFFSLLAGLTNLKYTFWASSFVAAILLVIMIPTAIKIHNTTPPKSGGHLLETK